MDEARRIGGEGRMRLLGSALVVRPGAHSYTHSQPGSFCEGTTVPET